MDNFLRQRSVIDFYAQLGETSATEIQQKLREAHGDAIALCTVYKWIQRFKIGNRRIHDEPRPGRPKTTKKPENIRRVDALTAEFACKNGKFVCAAQRGR